MQITVTVSDEVVRQAAGRGMPVLEFVESLITKGLDTVMGRPALHSAMERIRALRSPETGAKR
jgi:hypothetical protein